MKICNEHDYAIVSRFLRYYLIQLHEIKKKTLQTIFREIVLLHVKNFRQIQNLVNDFLVVYLLVEIDYRCETITCNDNFFDFVNKNKRTMKKYLSRIHEIQKSKKNKTRFTRNYIEIVNLQFFLSKSHYRFFVVRVELVSRAFFFFLTISSTHVIQKISSFLQTNFNQQLINNHDIWTQKFNRLNAINNQFMKQISSWFRIIDIDIWVKKLNANKKKLRQILNDFFSNSSYVLYFMFYILYFTFYR